MSAFWNILPGSTKTQSCRSNVSFAGISIPEWNQTCFNEQFATSLSSVINLTVTHKTNSSPSLEMVIIWLRNWFPVESGFCLPQRGTDSCQKCNEKWQFSQLSFACFTDRLTHNMSSSSCLSWPQRMFVHKPAGDHSLQCKFWWWEVFKKNTEPCCSFKLLETWHLQVQIWSAYLLAEYSWSTGLQHYVHSSI